MQLLKCRSLTRLIAFATGLFLSATARPQDGWQYHYFKETRPLQYDTNRVALLAADTANVTVHSQALTQYGITSPDAESVAIPRWSLARTPGASQSAIGVRNLVSQMAADTNFAFVSPVFVGDDGGPVIVTPDILVGFAENVSTQQAEAILSSANAGTILHRNWADMKGAYHLHTRLKNGTDVLALANQLAERPEVRFAEPDMIFTGKGSLIPNDPGFSNCWGIQNFGQSGGTAGMDMDGPDAWDITTGNPSILVVIIDVGVQPDHPDINQVPGTNTTSDASTNGGPVNSCDNHGTAVAGCVSAIINNGLGTVGIAPGCRSASARTFISNPACDGSWSSSSSWTVNSLAWAQTIGARVSNNSNIYGFQSSAIAQKYASTRAAGIVHFACAGNSSSSTLAYPASLSDVNAVAALDRTGNLASFSNYGVGLAFSAPGATIYTTDRTGSDGWVSGDYVFADGTSFASPYAAGVAALILSVNPSLNATNVEQIMQESSVDLGAAGYDTTYGWGFVNAYKAVLAAENETLTVASSGAGSGVAIAISPSDRNGKGSGTTQFGRSYTSNTVVSLTAPATVAGSIFQRWQRNGSDWSTSTSTVVTMNANYMMTAVYITPPPPAVLSVSPTSLLPTTTVGQNTASQTFMVWNSGGGTLNYTIATNAAWLSINPTNGASSGTANTHTVTYNSANLAVGSYGATITVSAPGTSNSPQTIGVSLTVNPPPPSTITMDSGYLYDRFGMLASTNSVAVLVADTGTNGFTDPRPPFSLKLGAVWGTDDEVIGLWNLSDCGTGCLFDQTTVGYTNGIAPGQKVQLYWFPSLTLGSNTVGVTYCGKYRDTNSPPLEAGTDPWQIPASGSSAYLALYTVSAGGSSPETTGWATFLVTGTPSVFQNWQMQYFGSTNDPNAAASADPYGTGMSNTNKFLAGFNPTNPSAYLHIIGITEQNANVIVTYLGANGDNTYVPGIASRTNVLDYMTGDAHGNYTNDGWHDTGQTNILSDGNGSGLVANMVDATIPGASTSRFYRVRVLLP